MKLIKVKDRQVNELVDILFPAMLDCEKYVPKNKVRVAIRRLERDGYIKVVGKSKFNGKIWGIVDD